MPGISGILDVLVSSYCLRKYEIQLCCLGFRQNQNVGAYSYVLRAEENDGELEKIIKWTIHIKINDWSVTAFLPGKHFFNKMADIWSTAIVKQIIKVIFQKGYNGL